MDSTKKIDIDDTIDIMTDIHSKLIEFVRSVRDFIDFEDNFVIYKSGTILINEIKDKRTYKKIVF